MKRIRNKILLLEDLIKKVEELKRSGKTIVQSHGIFDLIHPGITAHLNSAKNQADVLVVTVIIDRDVRMGLGRPIFSEKLRAENVASLEQVDYVCLVSDELPFASQFTVMLVMFTVGGVFIAGTSHNVDVELSDVQPVSIKSWFLVFARHQ